MFYDRFLQLCQRKGVTPTRAAIEAGISKSLVSKWKANESKEPSPEVIRKLANYFEISRFEVLEDNIIDTTTHKDYNFYDIFLHLCEKKGVSCKRATEEIGLSNSIATKWKKTGAIPQGDTLNRIAEYFNVTTDYLLGSEKEKPAEKSTGLTFDDFSYALFNQTKELTEENKNKLLEMAEFFRQQQEKEEKE